MLALACPSSTIFIISLCAPLLARVRVRIVIEGPALFIGGIVPCPVLSIVRVG